MRVAEFDDLFAAALIQVDRPSPTSLHLWLIGPAGLAAQVRDLTVRESACCSFFSFTVIRLPRGDGQGARRRDHAEELRLGVDVPAAHAGALSAVAQRACDILAASNRT